jgi:hypothetical protein
MTTNICIYIHPLVVGALKDTKSRPRPYNTLSTNGECSVLVSGNTHVMSCAEEEELLRLGSPPETGNLFGIFSCFLKK